MRRILIQKIVKNHCLQTIHLKMLNILLQMLQTFYLLYNIRYFWKFHSGSLTFETFT